MKKFDILNITHWAPVPMLPPSTEECGEKLDSNVISTEMCKHCLLEYLKQPYESLMEQKG